MHSFRFVVSSELELAYAPHNLNWLHQVALTPKDIIVELKGVLVTIECYAQRQKVLMKSLPPGVGFVPTTSRLPDGCSTS